MSMQISIHNPSARNTIKIVQEDKGPDEKTLKIGQTRWKEVSHSFIPPGESAVIWLDSKGRRIILEEMPS